jgi:AAA family ATP:ADP antiporter
LPERTDIVSLPVRLADAVNVREGEFLAALSGFALFFCLLAGYFMLRPIREAMAILGGIENLQWLFTATFVVMLVAVPLFAWLSSIVPRRYYVDWVHGFFVTNLIVFAVLFRGGDSVWVGRVFYVWISVYNLFVVSVAWSLMADAFDAVQARRLFAFVAAGASCGGITGPALGALLIGTVGQTGLTLLSAALLAATVPLKHYLMRWRETHGAGRPGAAPAESAHLPVAGNPFSGIALVLRSPWLLAVAAFVMLLATTSTFLYFEQARLVAERFHDRAAQIRVFSLLDFTVQALSLVSQLFITGRIANRFGVTALLAGVPALVGLAFIALALSPGFAMLAVAMIVRRVGEYAYIRPAREMLFAPLDAQTKYKAKNFIDTVVYRAGDAASAWVRTLLDALGATVVLVALAGAGFAAVWSGIGWYLGRRQMNGKG